METGQRLDRFEQSMIELRVGMAELAGEVRAAIGRLDGHDSRRDDVEDRIRTLERRSYSIPSLAGLIGLVGLGVALWTAFSHHV